MKKIFIYCYKTLFFVVFLFIAYNHLSIVKEIQNEIKKEVNIHILKKNFSGYETVVFSEHNIKNAEWEHSREFYFQNSMYDVFKVTYKDGIKYYHCIKDKKEAVTKKYLSFFHPRKTEFQKRTKSLLNTSRTLYVLYEEQHSEIPRLQYYKNVHVFNFKQSYHFIYFFENDFPPEQI